MSKQKIVNPATSKLIDFTDKAHRDYWTRRWGVSIHQLKAALHNTRSVDVKTIEDHLRERGAI